MLPKVQGHTCDERIPFHLLHRPHLLCEGVCNNDQKDSRKNNDKPTVKTRAECCSAKLEPPPQWQFHACKTGFTGNEWDGTITAMASDGPTHRAHSLGTCMSFLPLVLHSVFPTILIFRLPLLFSLPLLQQESCSPLLSVLCPSVTPPQRLSVTLQKLTVPPGKTAYPIPASSFPHHLYQYPLFSLSSRVTGQYPRPMSGALHAHFHFLFIPSYL